MSPANPYPINTQIQHLARSQSRNHGPISATVTSAAESCTSMDVPVKISGPMIVHDNRFDFEFVDKERADAGGAAEGRRESTLMGPSGLHAGIREKPSWSPDSAHSEEQWPGSY